MRLSIKHLLALWLLLLITVAGLLYNAYTKLKPEIFIGLISEQVQRNYPGTRFEVGKVDYRISVDFNMGLKNILLKRNGKLIGSLEEIEVRLPWWLLLFEKGNAQVNLNNLVVYIEKDRISQSRDKDTAGETADRTDASPVLDLALPDYLARAQFTLRAKNVAVKDLETSRRIFNLNKLLIREFQFGKNSAFELNFPVHITHKGVSLTSELWLFGDMTPNKAEWELKFRGEFRTSDTGERVQLEDLIIDGKAKLKPHRLDVSSELAFFIEKRQVGTGSFSVTDQEAAAKLKLIEFPLAFFGLFEGELTNPYLPKLTENATGTVEIKNMFKDQSVKITGYVDFPGQFLLGKGQDEQVPGSWKITFQGSKWETSFITPKGEISFFRRSVFDFNTSSIAQYVEELGFYEMDLKEPMQLVMPLDKLITSEDKDFFSTTISFKKCRLGDQVVTGLFRLGISPDLKFYSGELSEGKGSLKIDFKQARGRKELDLDATGFNWSEYYSFLGSYFQATGGVLSGKLEGRWEDAWINGQWKSKIMATSLQNSKGRWTAFFDKFWKTFEVESIPLSGQHWNVTLNNGLFILDSLLIDGANPVKMTGKLDTNLKKKSFLVLTYPKNRKWKPVRKELAGSFLERNENE